MSRVKMSRVFAAVAAVAAVLLLAASTADAYPRTRTVKDHRRMNLLMPDRPQCSRNVPCGWALYHQRSSSALRRYTRNEYTRNAFCDCPASRECVYQENRSDMRAYVFYCRNTADMAEGDIYRFPHAT